MKLEEILAAAGRHKRSRRVGRGGGSSRGRTAGRGQKGMGARSGAGSRAGYEGGQNSQVRRLPKRGFNNIFRVAYQVVNVQDFNEVFEDGATVDIKSLQEKGLISRPDMAIKVLGTGELKRKLTVCVNKASKSAAEKIVAAGGSVQILS